MPAKEQARRKQLDALKAEPRTMIFYEAPHRLLDCVRDIARCFGGDRVVVLARELTKLYETVARLPADELAAWVAGDLSLPEVDLYQSLTGVEVHLLAHILVRHRVVVLAELDVVIDVDPATPDLDVLIGVFG